MSNSKCIIQFKPTPFSGEVFYLEQTDRRYVLVEATSGVYLISRPLRYPNWTVQDFRGLCRDDALHVLRATRQADRFIAKNPPVFLDETPVKNSPNIRA